jgi:hypothetical protein
MIIQNEYICDDNISYFSKNSSCNCTDSPSNKDNIDCVCIDTNNKEYTINNINKNDINKCNSHKDRGHPYLNKNYTYDFAYIFDNNNYKKPMCSRSINTNLLKISNCLNCNIDTDTDTDTNTDKNILSCYCPDKNNIYQYNTITYFPAIQNTLTNVNGKLIYDTQIQYGTFLYSCKNCELKNNDLTCDCTQFSGNYKTSTYKNINDKCPNIANCDGTLKCGDC